MPTTVWKWYKKRYTCSAVSTFEQAQVEDVFRRALDGAREHGTPSWELRAATSLARLLRHQGCTADATTCLQPVYDRFTEGFDTADLIAAKQLLDELSDAGRH